MIRLAVLTARGHSATFIGALVALTAAAVLTMAWGMQLEALLRAKPPVERYAAATAVVAGEQAVGTDDDAILTERARVSSEHAGRLRAVPGVKAAIADVSVPARLGDRAATAHGWSSAALTPYVLTAGRAPSAPDEVVAGYRAKLGARLPLASNGPTRTVEVVGVASPRHGVSETAIFMTDAEAERLTDAPGRVDAIGVLAGAGFDVARLRAAAGNAEVLTGSDRGRAEHPELQQARTTLIPVTAAFGGLAMFIAMFVVAGTMGLSIQQREREIALLRVVAATPRQIRRMIAWEAVIVALVGSAAGLWPGAVLGEELGDALVRHGRGGVDTRGGGGRRRPHGGAARRPGRRAPRGSGATDDRARRGRGRAAPARPRARHRGPARPCRRCAAVHRGDHVRRARGGRLDGADDRDHARRGGRLPGTDRGLRRGEARGPGDRRALPRRRVPGLSEPRHRHAPVLVGQHADRAHGRDLLHAVLQHRDRGPRDHRAAAGGAGERPRADERGAGAAG